MKTRTRFHLLFLEIAMITRFVAITFAVVSPMCFKEPIRLAGFITNCVSTALLATCFILFFPSKFRNNIPPYIYLFLIGVNAFCAIAETILYGFAGFKTNNRSIRDDLGRMNEVIIEESVGHKRNKTAGHKKSETADNQDEIYIAAMAYVVASLVFSLVLFVALIAWSPVYESSEKQDIENRYSSRRQGSSPYRMFRKQVTSVSSKKQKSRESNRSKRDNSQKSNRSQHGNSQHGNSQRGNIQHGNSQREVNQPSNRSQLKADL